MNQMHRFLFEEKFKETTKAGKIENLLKLLKKKNKAHEIFVFFFL